MPSPKTRDISENPENSDIQQPLCDFCSKSIGAANLLQNSDSVCSISGFSGFSEMSRVFVVCMSGLSEFSEFGGLRKYDATAAPRLQKCDARQTVEGSGGGKFYRGGEIFLWGGKSSYAPRFCVFFFFFLGGGGFFFK